MQCLGLKGHSRQEQVLEEQGERAETHRSEQ